MSARPQIPADEWRRRAAALRPRAHIFIDGKFQPSVSGETFDNINPATGISLGAVAAGRHRSRRGQRSRRVSQG
jgi:hypothetical protein